MKKIIFTTIASMLSFAAGADYVMEGSMEGVVCTGLIIKSCAPVSIDAVRDDNGRLFNVSNRYGNVSEYDERAGRCLIMIKTGEVVADNLRRAQLPDFMHKNESGTYEEVSPDHLRFRCRRVD